MPEWLEIEEKPWLLQHAGKEDEHSQSDKSFLTRGEDHTKV